MFFCVAGQQREKFSEGGNGFRVLSELAIAKFCCFYVTVALVVPSEGQEQERLTCCFPFSFAPSSKASFSLYTLGKRAADSAQSFVVTNAAAIRCSSALSKSPWRSQRWPISQSKWKRVGYVHTERRGLQCRWEGRHGAVFVRSQDD